MHLESAVKLATAYKGADMTLTGESFRAHTDEAVAS